jgi:hypothetical protein
MTWPRASCNGYYRTVDRRAARPGRIISGASRGAADRAQELRGWLPLLELSRRSELFD